MQAAATERGRVCLKPSFVWQGRMKRRLDVAFTLIARLWSPRHVSFALHAPRAATCYLTAHAPLPAHILLLRFVQAGSGGRPSGAPPPPSPCDDRLLRALSLLHVPPSSASPAAAAAAKLLALLPPPVRIDRAECARLLLQLQHNSHTILDGAGTETGVGLYPAAAMLTHDCCPNITLSWSADGATVYARAALPIAAGAVLAVPYIDPFRGVAERRSLLQSLHAFHCSCSRCSIEAAWDEGVKSAAAHVTHSVSVISSAVDQGALTPLDAVVRLNALSQDVAFTSLPPAHSARADVMAAVSKLAAESGAGAGAAFRAVAARELAGVYRVQVGGGLHIKPLALLLTGISIQALAEIDAGKGHEGRPAKLQELSDQLQVLLRDCRGLQGEDGALVFIAKKLQSQVSKDKRRCFVAICVFLLLKDARI